MRAAVLNDHDAPPQPSEFDDPQASDGQLLVNVSVAGVNPVDIWTARGVMGRKVPLPSVAGREGIGTTEDGRRVYFDTSIAPFGSYAERTLVEEGTTIDVPDGVDDQVAVAFGIAGLAAWLGLGWRGGLSEGESVLVLGASGTVGIVAVQAAKLMGAGAVVAAGRNEERLAVAEQRGADATLRLDGDASAMAQALGDAGPDGGFDLVLDPLWGEPARAAIDNLAMNGRMVLIGNSAAQETELASRPVRSPNASLLGHTNFNAPLEVKAEAFQAMCRHAAAGELAVDVEELPLDDAEQAWARQLDGPNTKLVLRP
jgi:NADPH:quinone reductase-like Zn-dependent oxidoreductase